MKRPPKSKKTNQKSSKKLKNGKSRISKKKEIMSSSSNEKNTNLGPRNPERILSTVKRYSVNES